MTVDSQRDANLQELSHSDEVRASAEVPAVTRRNSEAEVKLARQLIGQEGSRGPAQDARRTRTARAARVASGR